jgi:hypothetical protein
VDVFFVFGPVLVVWVALLAFLGISREGFPGSPRAERAVGAVSIVLVLAAIAAALYQGASEEDAGGETAALVR